MRRIFLVVLLLSGCSPNTNHGGAAPFTVQWKSAVATGPVPDDPDDVAIWIHPSNPALSLVVGTNKVAAPGGALVVFDLQGKILQTIPRLDRPNNVDLRQAVRLGDRTVDLVAVTERRRSKLRFYEVDASSRRLKEAGEARVFEGEQGDFAAPMGIALYLRGDGALFAITGRKSGPADGYLWQYRVEPGLALKLERKFGRFSGTGEIEAIVSDDASGFVYYADEGAGIRKYAADPAAPEGVKELALFGTSGYKGDREGLAIYRTGERTGYLLSTDQIPGGSRYLVYPREGARGLHDHPLLGAIEGGADATDGIEATERALGAAFPQGMLVTMNSGGKNFLYFRWTPMPARGHSIPR
jgi:3-phytase